MKARVSESEKYATVPMRDGSLVMHGGLTRASDWRSIFG